MIRLELEAEWFRKEGAVALYGGRTGTQLTIMDALTTGYKFLLKPAFVIPILVIGVIVNAIVITALVPFLVGMVGGGDSVADPTGMMGAMLGGVIGAIFAALIGGIILNLYGQIWAVMASTGEPPTMQAAFSQVGNRWVSVLGAGLIVGVIGVGAMLAILVIGGLLGGLGALVWLVGGVVLVYFLLRLSMAGWLAAEGMSAMQAVNASFELTRGAILTIFGWSLVIGIAVAIISGVAGIVLNLIPLVGSALTQTIGAAFGFGASVTLFRRIKDRTAA